MRDLDGVEYEEQALQHGGILQDLSFSSWLVFDYEKDEAPEASAAKKRQVGRFSEGNGRVKIFRKFYKRKNLPEINRAKPEWDSCKWILTEELGTQFLSEDSRNVIEFDPNSFR